MELNTTESHKKVNILKKKSIFSVYFQNWRLFLHIEVNNLKKIEMKSKWLWVLCALFMWCGCEKPDPEVPEDAYVTWTKKDLGVFPAAGGEAKVSFYTNSAWSAKANTWSVGWCRITPNQGDAGNVTLKVVVDKNMTYEERRATIVVNAGEVSDTLVVIQAARVEEDSYLRLSADTCMVEKEGKTVQVNVEANVDYDVEVPHVEWLHETTKYGSGVQSRYHYFVVDKNDTGEMRSVEIIFANDAEGVADTLYVVQKGGGEKGGIDDMPEHPL